MVYRQIVIAEIVDDGENIKFATIADNKTAQQHYANMSNVHLFTKIEYKGNEGGLK